MIAELAELPEGATCTHCRLAVPAGRIVPDRDEQFCCGGCETAYRLIRSCGLDAYYALVDDADETERAPVGDADVRYDELDRPLFADRYVRDLGEGHRSCTLMLEGIHCAACIWLLEKLPRLVDGMIGARVDWARSILEVTWSSDRCRLSQIARTVAELGYRPHPVQEEEQRSRHHGEMRRQIVQIGIAGAAAGNNMLIAIAIYLGMFSSMAADVHGMLRVASCVVGLVSVFGPGRAFMQGAMVAIRTRTPHMDLPIALGLGVGAIAGLVNTLRGVGEIYFDTLSVLVFLLLVGRFIQSRQQHRAADAVRLLKRLTPPVAHKVVGERRVDVPSEVLEVGDVVEVRVAEAFPVDGRVVRGKTTVDQSILTGESRPVSTGVGDAAAAGTINLSGVVVVRSEAVGEDTRIGRVAEIVESAATRRPAIVQWADSIGATFVMVVILVAMATFATWLLLDPARAVDNTVALLIVACPCALGLATPLALSVAVARAAKRRILIKGGDVLQRLSRPGTIWLDKTGTLTTGRMTVLDWFGDTSVLGLVAAVERHASHPVGRALVSWAEAHGDGLAPAPDEVEPSQQGGIVGRFGSLELVIGNQAFVATRARVPDALLESAASMVQAGHAPVFVAAGGVVVAVAALGDPLRPDAGPAIERLRREGWTVGIASGDHREIVREVGRRLGLPPERCLGGLTPGDKVELVSRGEHVVMVGDGVNDSAALAAAGVGIATHEGAEASLRAAPVYLGRPGLLGVLELLAASRSTMRTIRRNLAVSLTYNSLAVGLAAAGLINPLVAAVLMPMSSLSVVGSSLVTHWRTPTP
jgi:P-type Cu2+ transporter